MKLSHPLSLRKNVYLCVKSACPQLFLIWQLEKKSNKKKEREE